MDKLRELIREIIQEEFRQLDKNGVDLEHDRPIVWVPKDDYNKWKFSATWNRASRIYDDTEYYCVIFNSKDELHTYNHVQGYPIYDGKGVEFRVPENYG